MRRFLTVATLVALLVLHKRPAEATINFPATLDNNSTLFNLVNGDVYIAQHHNNPKDAILALEAKVGVDGSAVTSSLDYLVKNSASVNPGHTHTGTSVNFSDGSAATPGLRFGSPVTDTNTGLFHPTSGAVAIASGGAEITRVTATGLGIFVASPNFPLDIAGTVRLQSASTLCFGGTGAADNDTCVSRSAAHVFKHVGSGRFDDVATTDDSLQLNGIAAKTGKFLTVKRLPADANPSFQLAADGVTLGWGAGGASAIDVTLARSGAGALTIGGSLTTTGAITATTTLTANGDASLNGTGTQTIGGGSASTVSLAGGTVVILDSSPNSITLADSTNIVVNTTNGTKIGTSTSQKLGFFNATPIIQPIGTTDLRTALINLGLYATGGATPLNLNGGALTTTGVSTLTELDMPHNNLALANGANTNIALAAGTVFRITGPTGAFSLNGLTGGVSGRMVVLISTVAQTFTITNEATSTAANQITTNTGADIVCTATEKATVTLVYDATSSKWIVTSVMNCATV